MLLFGCLCSPGGCQLRYFVSWFPRGWIGGGLLLLRLGMAILAAEASLSLLLAPQPLVTASVVAGCTMAFAAAALAGGILTPVCGLMMAVWSIAAFLLGCADPRSLQAWSTCLQTLLLSGAVVILGPGAYSLDGIFFGPREIVIPTRRGPSSL